MSQCRTLGYLTIERIPHLNISVCKGMCRLLQQVPYFSISLFYFSAHASLKHTQKRIVSAHISTQFQHPLYLLFLSYNFQNTNNA